MSSSVDYFIREGDSGETITDTLKDSSGAAVDISGATVEWAFRPLAGGTGFTRSASNAQTGDGSDGSKGKVSYVWVSGDTADPGYQLANWVVTYGGGEVQTFPNDGYLLVYITPAAPTTVGQDYITVEQFKKTLNLQGQTYADEDVRMAVTAASRAIDNLCNRRFYLDADAEQIRYYTPYALTSLQIDDLVTFTALATDSGGNNTFLDSWTLHTDFELEPLNAAADGWPYTKIVIRPNGSFTLPMPYSRSVRLTGQFGWPAVPTSIEQATTIVASKLMKRAREAPFGVLAIGLNGEAVRLARLDPDVMMLVGPYMKHRIAVA